MPILLGLRIVHIKRVICYETSRVTLQTAFWLVLKQMRYSANSILFEIWSLWTYLAGNSAIWQH